MRTFRPIHAKIIDDAVRADPSIAYYQDEIMEAPGSTPEYLESLGLTKHLMKKLEAWGLAIRALTPDKKGGRVRWVLLRPTNRPKDGDDGRQGARATVGVAQRGMPALEPGRGIVARRKESQAQAHAGTLPASFFICLSCPARSAFCPRDR